MRKMIMIVDDDKEFLDEIEETLSLSGYNTVAINDSTSVLETALIVKPEIILLDLKMERMDGFEVADKLKQISETVDIPIIAMTGYFSKQECSVLIKKHDMKECILKPIRPLDIIWKIESALTVSKR